MIPGTITKDMEHYLKNIEIQLSEVFGIDQVMKSHISITFENEFVLQGNIDDWISKESFTYDKLIDKIIGITRRYT